ncbi:MAG TPA: aspartate carbamoyltransferase catalytic subunit [Candidatus Caccalectryoclostridium excrementigallinarum]|uniref:Aspartate carbamoyltransferase n=1 Tax=Candidatus Caccalectryoclostridium excrementigallinarum TaxID=2840710 RepID=A0A9D1MM21_9FIRM|nr:aspartate carbamoyltransferase catalytic subunit [Candidatus Caccalectryoclostridium excrementigallinarum]
MKDLLQIRGLSLDRFNAVLDRADEYYDIVTAGKKPFPKLKDRSVITLFYENSTRTRTSFESAAKYLGAEVVNISVGASSVQKGESLKDTALTLDAMYPDVIVMRHSQSGAPHRLAGWVRAHVINGGDGLHAHPTQALLDMFTARRRFGDLKGRKAAIVGDIKHSRVARSNIYAMTLAGMQVNVFGAGTLMPAGIEQMPCKVCKSLEEAIKGCDIVMALRIQLERMKGGLFPSAGEYNRYFGLGKKAMELAAPGAIVMHPGPVNRGVELSHDLLDTDMCVKDEQVTGGLCVRMALLDMLINKEL